METLPYTKQAGGQTPRCAMAIHTHEMARAANSRQTGRTLVVPAAGVRVEGDGQVTASGCQVSFRGDDRL